MKFNKKMNPLKGGTPRNVVLSLIIFVVTLSFLTYIAEHAHVTKELNYSQFLKEVESGLVQSVRVSGQEVAGTYKDGTRFEAKIAENPSNWELLQKNNVEITVLEPAAAGVNPWHFIGFTLILAFIGLIWFFVRQSRGSGNGSSALFSFGKSNARMFNPSQIKVTFKDVAGAKEAKEELQDVVEFLKNPAKYKKIGAELTRGVLLVGEPGNGKTLLAKAIAGEANCPFFSITGSDFIEVFVGVGASRIRDLFAQARRKSPCIIFIDEIDAIGRRRGSGLGGGNDEREQTLNQLLTEMDGFSTADAPVIVIAATNMPGVLDKALLRPGRFDRMITVPFPDEAARRQILEINAQKVSIAPEVDLSKIIEESAGFSCADLANCVNQAAIHASRNGRATVTQEDFDVAFKKLLESKRAGHGEHKTTSEESTARMYLPSQIKVRFNDVAGLEEAKEEMHDFIDFLKDPEKYKKIGAKLTKGVLLVGDPGNGKTLLARAVAGEAGCSFFSVSGSEFIEKYVGVGAARVRDLFNQARKHKPAIIFIDEIDAVGGKRDASGGDREHSQTLNQLLTEMDGFEVDDLPVIVLAATNRADILDPALKRPGRFDRHVTVTYPDLKARRAILDVHTRNVKIDPTINLDTIARATPGFSGASVAHLVNEAAINAVKHGRDAISMDDMEEARDKVMMGKQMKSMVQRPEDLEATAWHEAGHVILTMLQPEISKTLHKATILPRGSALGFMSYFEEHDRYGHSKEELEADIVATLGGRVGEMMGMGKQFTGVTGDLQHVTAKARHMVRYYGMSDKLGLIYYQEPLSPQTERLIEEEVKAIIDRCYEKAQRLLGENRDKLELLTKELIRKELLSAEEMYELLGMKAPELHKLT